MSQLARLLTIVVGAVPALILGLYSVFVGLFGILGLISGAVDFDLPTLIVGLLLSVWQFLALWGVYALWAVVIGPSRLSKSTLLGLVAGCISIVGVYLIALSKVSLDGGASLDPSVTWVWVFVGPACVAVWHICRGHRQRQ